MPILYLRKLTGKDRTQSANRQLAHFLALIAGAADVGGYIAVKQYTSHMSGLVASMADSLALGDLRWVLAGLVALLSFLLGAALCAILVNWGRRRNFRSMYALPLVFEAGLLAYFGLMGSHLHTLSWTPAPTTVILLCFTMGLQNAIITKISDAEIRTTHVTGTVTDMGIELGKALYWNRRRNVAELAPVRADWDKLRLLASLVGLFFLGGVIGAIGFRRIGFETALPLAAILLLLAVVPVVDDLRGLR